MQNILSTLFLSDASSLFPSLLLFGIGIVTIILDLKNRRRERRQGQQRVWHQRIVMLTGIMLIIIGLMMLPFIDIIPFPRWLSSLLSMIFLLVVVALGIYAFLLIIHRTIKLSILPQEIFVGRVNAERTPIAANPLLVRIRARLIGGAFLLGTAMLLGLFQLSALVTRYSLFTWGWGLLITVPLLAFWLIRMSIQLRALLHIEALRLSYKTERRIDSASVLSASESLEFLAPVSIPLRIKRIPILLFVVLIAVLIIPSALPLVVQFTQPASFSGQSDISSLVFWIALGLIPLVLGFIPLFIVRTTIEAKENGLRTGDGTFLHWHEARLFACYKLPGILPGRSAITIYELSGSNRVITWRWLHNPHSVLALWEPLLPVDEYHRQMQRLCDLVLEKTGLPLYDMDQLAEEESTG